MLTCGAFSTASALVGVCWISIGAVTDPDFGASVCSQELAWSVFFAGLYLQECVFTMLHERKYVSDIMRTTLSCSHSYRYERCVTISLFPKLVTHRIIRTIVLRELGICQGRLNIKYKLAISLFKPPNYSLSLC